jgi:DNA-binding GntR family transcriptional regulator
MSPARSTAPRAAIAPLLHESLGERVYRTVRDLILSQVFPPGSKLNVEPGDHAGLEASMKEMEQAAAAGAIEQYSRAAIDFHDRVLGAARNQVLSRLLDNVYAQILVLRLRSLYLPERVESSVAEHRELFEAVVAGDADRGERLARAHADHVLQDALEFTRRAEQGR